MFASNTQKQWDKNMEKLKQSLKRLDENQNRMNELIPNPAKLDKVARRMALY